MSAGAKIESVVFLGVRIRLDKVGAPLDYTKFTFPLRVRNGPRYFSLRSTLEFSPEGEKLIPPTGAHLPGGNNPPREEKSPPGEETKCYTLRLRRRLSPEPETTQRIFSPAPEN